MSADLRRRIAYFGPREKVYPTDADTEVPGLPTNWRRVLCMSWPFPVAGPCGNVYADTEHAIAAFRAHYTTNNPALAQLFRPEHEPFSVWRVCRRWSTNNGLSLLLSEPDDRVWFVIRDRCMFDLIYQRVCRDEQYRHILGTIIDAGYIPVYHVRTADSHTYWGAIIDRTKINLTQAAPAQAAPVNLEELAKEKAVVWSDDPTSILIGKNRLGSLMQAALDQYRRVYLTGISLRAKVLSSVSKVPAIPLTKLTPPPPPSQAVLSSSPLSLSLKRSRSSDGEEDLTSCESDSLVPTPKSARVDNSFYDQDQVEAIIDDLLAGDEGRDDEDSIFL